MQSKVGVYMSEWGAFEIPSDIEIEMYDTNKPTLLDRLFGFDRKPIMDIAPFPKNPEFWRWLHKENVKAGKPVIPLKVWEEASKIGMLPRSEFPEYFALRFYEMEKRLEALEGKGEHP